MRGLIVAAMLAAAPAAAQDDYGKVTIRTEQLAPGVAVLFGSGGNIGVATGPDASVLIDDEFAPLGDKIIAAVKALSPTPIKFVVNTHWHGDHTGGNANFGAAGVVIVAHDNVRTRMASDQFIALIKSRVPASPKIALPVVTFGDGVTLHLNGEDIRAVHVAPAHTDGDSLVVFTRANVIHMGDTFLTAGYPLIDRSSGGDAAGFVAAADRGLALGNAATKYIPGHGAVADRAALIEWRAMIVTVIDRVTAQVAAGKSLGAIIAAKPTAEYDARWGHFFITPDQFVQTVYDSVIAKRAGK